MCLALISTAHPLYPLILIDNRDEYLTRPTAPAQWWDAPDTHILGGRDLLRHTQGTWLGVTKCGRIAVLTNFIDATNPVGLVSRGSTITSFLRDTSNMSTADFVHRLVESGDVKDVGGFSLACGKIGEPLAIVSNRVSSKEGISWVAGERGQTIALSNTAYGDRSWPKIVKGEDSLGRALAESYEKGEDEDVLIGRLLELLSSDDLPGCSSGGCEVHFSEFTKTICVPIVGTKWNQVEKMEGACDGEKIVMGINSNGSPQEELGMSGPFATQKQTVILVGGNGRVKFFERTLFDSKARPISKGEGDRIFEFEIEDWKVREGGKT